MSAIAVSFIGYAFKAVIFWCIAYAGIILGKKYRDKRDAAKAADPESK